MPGLHNVIFGSGGAALAQIHLSLHLLPHRCSRRTAPLRWRLHLGKCPAAAATKMRAKHLTMLAHCELIFRLLLKMTVGKGHSANVLFGGLLPNPFKAPSFSVGPEGARRARGEFGLGREHSERVVCPRRAGLLPCGTGLPAGRRE